MDFITQILFIYLPSNFSKKRGIKTSGYSKKGKSEFSPIAAGYEF